MYNYLLLKSLICADLSKLSLTLLIFSSLVVSVAFVIVKMYPSEEEIYLPTNIRELSLSGLEPLKTFAIQVVACD